MNAPLVSILIPCYNAGRYLRRTLDSVLAQTYENIEIICTNDGSKDDTLSILKEYADKHESVSCIDQENQGQCAAFNRAYERSNGAYISFFDADDLLTPNKIELQIEKVFNGGAVDDVMATCEWARFFEEPEEAAFIPRPLWQTMKPVDWLVQSWTTHEMMHGATWLIPRAVLDKSGLWDERLSLINDFDFFCRVMLACREIVFVSGARTYYRSAVDGNLSGQKTRKAWKSAMLATELGAAALLEREDSERTRYAVATCFQRLAYEMYPNEKDLVGAAQSYAEKYGGSDVIPHTGGRIFRALSRVIGWRGASRLQQFVYSLGYYRWGLLRAKSRAAAAHSTERNGE